MNVIYQPGPDPYIADCLSRKNCTKNEDGEIEGININSDSINSTADIPIYMTTKDIQTAA